MRHSTATNIMISVAILATLAFTLNPLALLGFFFLQAPSQLQEMAEYGTDDAVAEDTQYNEHGTGFNAKL